MSWCQTYSGRGVYPLEPESTNDDDILIEDIAHSLSHICRFNGHCKTFYSVAQHSLLVANEIYKETQDIILAQQGLFHDASEAYLGDIPSPIKMLLTNYKENEAKWMKKIFNKFGISYPLNKIVKITDMRMLMTEARQLMVWPPSISWNAKYEPYNITIDPLDPEKAKRLFLDSYKVFIK